jgi:hypothetical protein
VENNNRRVRVKEKTNRFELGKDGGQTDRVELTGDLPHLRERGMNDGRHNFWWRGRGKDGGLGET